MISLFSSALNSETNEYVAIKKIANAFDNKIDAKRTLREIKLLRHMDHENVSESLYVTMCVYIFLRIIFLEKHFILLGKTFCCKDALR